MFFLRANGLAKRENYTLLLEQSATDAHDTETDLRRSGGEFCRDITFVVVLCSEITLSVIAVS